MDLVILVIFIILILFYFRSFDSFVYFIAISDIFLRILSFITTEFGDLVPEFTKFVKDTIPASIPAIINQYSTDIFNTLLMIGYVIVYILFEVYIIKYLFKKKRR